MKRVKRKDPCEMTREEAITDLAYWAQLLMSGKTKAHGKDVEGRMEMLADRLRLLGDSDSDNNKRD